MLKLAFVACDQRCSNCERVRGDQHVIWTDRCAGTFELCADHAVSSGGCVIKWKHSHRRTEERESECIALRITTLGNAVFQFGESDAGDADGSDLPASESALHSGGAAANQVNADIGIEQRADHTASRWSGSSD